MIDLQKILDAVNKSMLADKKRYLSKFTTGDRIVKHILRYVNIVDVETGNISQEPDIKGIFIEPVGDIMAKVIFEGDEKPTVIDVMFIQFDEDA